MQKILIYVVIKTEICAKTDINFWQSLEIVINFIHFILFNNNYYSGVFVYYLYNIFLPNILLEPLLFSILCHEMTF